MLRAHGFTPSYWWRLCCCEHTSSLPVIGGVCVAASTRVHSQLLVASVLLRAYEFTPSYWWRLCCYEHTGSLPVISGVCVAASTRVHSQLLVASVLLQAHGFTPDYWWRLFCCETTGSLPDIGGVCVAHLFSFLCCIMFCLSLPCVCVPGVVSVSGLSILDCPFCFL